MSNKNLNRYLYYQKLDKAKILEKNNLFWKELAQKAYPVTKGKYTIPISLEPFYIDEKTYKNFHTKLSLVISSAKKLANAYFIDSDIKETLSLNKEEALLIKASKDENFIGIIRPDFFWSDTPQLVELNADYPDGFFMHDITGEKIFNFLEDQKLFLKTNHTQIFNDLLLNQGISKDKHVFIGYDADRFFVDEFYLTKIQLKKMGWENVSVGSFESLEYNSKTKQFIFDKKIVDVIRRGSELFKIKKIPNLLNNIIESKKSGNLIVINNFKNRLLGHKGLLAVMWDEKYHKYLEPNEIDAIKSLIPKTLILSEEIVNKINKEKYVLKPADKAEGEGVVIGASVNQDEWDKAIKSALADNDTWILQKKVNIPEDEFLFIENNKIISKKLKYDFDPYLILDNDEIKIGRILVRFSDSSILNIMQGGGLTYAYIKNS